MAAQASGVGRDEGRAWFEAAKAGQLPRLQQMLRANPLLLMYKVGLGHRLCRA